MPGGHQPYFPNGGLSSFDRTGYLPPCLVLLVPPDAMPTHQPFLTRRLTPRNSPRAPGQTVYALTFATGSVVFSGSAKMGDPFLAIGGDNVRLVIPGSASGNPTVGDADGSGLGPTIDSWGGFVGQWNGTLAISKRRWSVPPQLLEPGAINLRGRA